jgi:hypothetical protein
MGILADIREWIFTMKVKMLLWEIKHDAFRTGR